MKPITIKDADLKDIESFNTIKKQLKLKTSGATFGFLIKNYQNPANQNQAAPNNSEALQNALTEIENLKSLLSEQTQKTEQLIDEKNTLFDQYNELKNAAPEPIKLTGTQLIYEPDQALFKDIQRVGLYLIKKGQVNRHQSDIAQQVITKLVRYGIKNEFDHVLK